MSLRRSTVFGAIAIVHWLGDLASNLSLQDALAPPKVIFPLTMKNLMGHLVADDFVDFERPAELLKLVYVNGPLASVPSKLLKIVSALDGMSAHSGPCPVSVSVGLSSRPIIRSSYGKYAGIRAMAALACTALLKQLKGASSLYEPLFGPDGRIAPAQEMLEVFHDLAMGFLEPICFCLC